jgi:hypothetical protein
MESTELVRKLQEQGHIVQLFETPSGEILIGIDGLRPIPLLWAQRVVTGEISVAELKEDLLGER